MKSNETVTIMNLRASCNIRIALRRLAVSGMGLLCITLAVPKNCKCQLIVLWTGEGHQAATLRSNTQSNTSNLIHWHTFLSCQSVGIILNKSTLGFHVNFYPTHKHRWCKLLVSHPPIDTLHRVIRKCLLHLISLSSSPHVLTSSELQQSLAAPIGKW